MSSESNATVYTNTTSYINCGLKCEHNATPRLNTAPLITTQDYAIIPHARETREISFGDGDDDEYIHIRLKHQMSHQATSSLVDPVPKALAFLNSHISSVIIIQ